MGRLQLEPPRASSRGHWQMGSLRPSDVATVSGKGGKTETYVDHQLAHIGRTLQSLHGAKREIERQIREWEAKQDERLKLVRGLKDVKDFPTRQQSTVLNAFTLALSQENPIMLTVAFQLCEQVGAHTTAWRTDSGESVAVAYQRRLAELEGSNEEA